MVRLARLLSLLWPGWPGHRPPFPDLESTSRLLPRYDRFRLPIPELAWFVLISHTAARALAWPGLACKSLPSRMTVPIFSRSYQLSPPCGPLLFFSMLVGLRHLLPIFWHFIFPFLWAIALLKNWPRRKKMTLGVHIEVGKMPTCQRIVHLYVDANVYQSSSEYVVIHSRRPQAGR